MKYFLLLAGICLAACNTESVKIDLPDYAKINAEEEPSGYNLITYKNNQKCNLTDGYYWLDSTIIDSAEIHFLSQYLAKELYSISRGEKDCDYPVMTRIALYASKEDYQKDESDYISTCSITPMNYAGDVYINTFKLKQLKK